MGITGAGTSADELWDVGSREAIAEHVRKLTDDRLEARIAEVGEDDWSMVERLVLIRTIDSLWVEHLTELDDMRRGIGLRGYAQQDPLNEFRREAFRLYEELRGLIRHGVASSIFRVTVTRGPGPSGNGADPAVGAVARARCRRARAVEATAGTATTATSGGAPVAVAAGGRRLHGPAGRSRRQVPSPSRSRESLGDAVVSGPAGAPRRRRQTRLHADGARIGRNDPCWCGSG